MAHCVFDAVFSKYNRKYAMYGVPCHYSYGCRPYDDVTVLTVVRKQNSLCKSRFECETIEVK